MEKIDFADNPTAVIPIKQVQPSGTIVYVSDSAAVYFLMKSVNYPMQSGSGEVLFTGEKFRWVRLSGLLDTTDSVCNVFYETHKAAIEALKNTGDFFQFSSFAEFLGVAKRRNWA